MVKLATLQVTVLLPPSVGQTSNPYPSIEKMRECSPVICAALHQRQIGLVKEDWNGELDTLPQDKRCLVHFTCSLGGTGFLTKACNELGHLLFCHDRVFNGNGERTKEVVEQWLEDAFPAQEALSG